MGRIIMLVFFLIFFVIFAGIKMAWVGVKTAYDTVFNDVPSHEIEAIINSVYRQVDSFLSKYYKYGNITLSSAIDTLSNWTFEFIQAKGYNIERNYCTELVIEAAIKQGFATEDQIRSAMAKSI